jgi:hypothetical protein
LSSEKLSGKNFLLSSFDKKLKKFFIDIFFGSSIFACSTCCPVCSSHKSQVINLNNHLNIIHIHGIANNSSFKLAKSSILNHRSSANFIIQLNQFFALSANSHSSLVLEIVFDKKSCFS